MALPVNNYISNMVQNPTLPQGTSLVPDLITSNSNELLDPNAAKLQPAPVAAVPTMVTAPTAEATVVDPTSGQSSLQNVQQVKPFTTQSSNGMTEEQRQEALRQSSVKNQLTDLLDFEPDNAPAWAKAAVRTTNDFMAARGLGSSSIAAGATTTAIMDAATQIATVEAQLAQQRLLSDAASINAAEQINASNSLQLQTFKSQLEVSIRENNANRKNSLTSLLAQLDVDTQKTNLAVTAEINRFNSELKNQREQFESRNRLEIDQANVVWRRNVNTANTAAVNAANQFNVQNRFNLSQTALNNVWQQWRDEATWSFQASENAQARAFNIAMGSNNRAWIESQYNAARQYQSASNLGSVVRSVFS